MFVLLYYVYGCFYCTILGFLLFFFNSVVWFAVYLFSFISEEPFDISCKNNWGSLHLSRVLVTNHILSLCLKKYPLWTVNWRYFCTHLCWQIPPQTWLRLISKKLLYLLCKEEDIDRVRGFSSDPLNLFVEHSLKSMYSKWCFILCFGGNFF